MLLSVVCFALCVLCVFLLLTQQQQSLTKDFTHAQSKLSSMKQKLQELWLLERERWQRSLQLQTTAEGKPPDTRLPERERERERERESEDLSQLPTADSSNGSNEIW